MKIKLLIAACVAAVVLSLAACGHGSDRPAQFVGSWTAQHVGLTWDFVFNADGSFHGDCPGKSESLEGEWYVKDGVMHWIYKDKDTPFSSLAPDLSYKMKIYDNDYFETWDAKGNQSVFHRVVKK